MEFNPIAGIVLLCGAMSLTIAIYAWQRRATVGAQAFAFFMFSMTLYIVGYSMELASPDVSGMLFWSKIEYIGILTFPTTYLVFVTQYTGHEKWQTRRNIALLLILPTALLIAKFFDENFHLIYSSTAVDPGGAIPLLSFTKGPLYLVVVGYNLLIVTFGNYLLVQKWRFGSPLFRRQTTILLIAAIILYLMYGFYLTGIPLFQELKELDLNPFVYTIWGVAVGLAIFRHQLFNLAPIARDTLIEILSDGVIVFDAQDRVVDANPEAQKIFGWLQPPVGQPVEKIMNHWIDQASLSAIEGPTRIETHLTKESTTTYYELMISPLRNKNGQRIGNLIVIHDISERKEIEKQLQELSLVDELTGLTNRRGFRMLAIQMIHMAYRMKRNAALIYIDLDRLKWINDNLGHTSGDQALIDTGHLLKNTFRTSDIIARYGGDEFVILAVESAENPGENMLARLQQQLAAYNMQAHQNFQLSISIGMVRYKCDTPRSLELLLEEADRAMYENKQAKKANNPM